MFKVFLWKILSSSGHPLDCHDSGTSDACSGGGHRPCVCREGSSWGTFSGILGGRRLRACREDNSWGTSVRLDCLDSACSWVGGSLRACTPADSSRGRGDLGTLQRHPLHNYSQIRPVLHRHHSSLPILLRLIPQFGTLAQRILKLEVNVQ